MNKRIKMRHTGGDYLFYLLNSLLVFIFLTVTLYPLIFTISASFSSSIALAQGRVWLFPVDVNADGYITIFNTPAIMQSFLNSIWYTLLGTSINVVFTVLAAYPLSRKDFCGRGWIMFLFMFTMLFGGGMIPSYLLIRDLHLMNSVWALVLPGALSVWNMTITMNYFKLNISDEMLEAAQIDGCSDIRFLLSFVLPLSKAILSVIALFYAVGHWNSYFSAMMYISSPQKYPLQLVLRDILIQNSMQNMTSNLDIGELMRKQNIQDLLKYSVIVVSSVPMMLIYPFMQKHLVKGVMLGSLKG